MDKQYQPKQFEDKIYQEWEKSGAFEPKKTGEAYCIIMPPPNANGRLHVGHAMFVTVEDILIRYQRMRGKAALWLPGADHAGILTQVVYERELAKKKKTRFDLGRKEFYRQCYEFTQNNKKTMYSQLKKLGASCDWSREKFTLDPVISQMVLETFVKLRKDGLVYRSERMVNWCPRCMTALSNLEVEHVEQKTPLYYMHYGPFILATVRPETKFGDTAIAVNPKDKRYKKWIGKEIEVEELLGKFKMKVIADKQVDPEFGTGVVKVTPAHDPNDFEVWQRHKKEIPGPKQVIGFDGRLNEKTGKYAGLTVKKARKKVVADLEKEGLIEKIDEDYEHTIARCERCKTMIEPLVSLQWFVKAIELAKPAIKAVKEGKTEIVPKRFEKQYFQWMENIYDWCVSRQLWWGHRIPVWYCGLKGLSGLQKEMNPGLVKKAKNKGCGEVKVSRESPKSKCKCGVNNWVQDPDTLDTWFSSGQWPVTTLKTGKKGDFKRFYPTSGLETGYEILFFWVARMMMMGLYSTGKVPFKKVYLHGLVRDVFGEKMSKSKGNVVDPLDVIEKYGADALRMGLIAGVAAGNDSKIGEEKIKGYRNFANKVWNMGRFILNNLEKFDKNLPWYDKSLDKHLSKKDKEIIKKTDELIKIVTDKLENFRLSDAALAIYEFMWHELADKYIEYAKKPLGESNKYVMVVLRHVYAMCLKLLHPFMPFVTETIWREIPDKFEPGLIESKWPKVN